MASGGIGNQSLATLFQARLDTVNGVSSLLWLRPYQGNKVVISGQTLKSLGAGIACNVTFNLITAAGADSGAPGAANTLYYVYVSNILATFSPETLRLSATPPVLVNGVKYLGAAGNALNWRFVGWVQLNATPQFESSLANRLIVNYYNRLILPMLVTPGYVDDNAVTSFNVSSGTWITPAVAIGGGVISQLSFISNGEDAVGYSGMTAAAIGPNGTPVFGVGEDSVTQAAQMVTAVNNGPYDSMCISRSTLFPEGIHTLDLLVASSPGGNTANFLADFGRIAGGAADSPTTTLTASVMG